METSKKSYCFAMHSKGEFFFLEVSKFFEKAGLTWDNMCGNTTDGGPAMVGSHSG